MVRRLSRFVGYGLVAGLVACSRDQSLTDPPAGSSFRPLFSILSPSPIDFDSYALGTIDGQNDWTSTGAAGSGCAVYDHQVVGNSYGYLSFGTQSLRMSNAVTSGCFGDHTFSKRVTDPAGETGAAYGGFSSGTLQRHFEAQWEFASTIPGAEQPGLSVVASPDRGDGARMSWIQMADAPGGLEINFFDVQGESNPANFVPSPVVSGLDRTVPHAIKITMDFADGPGNDVVKVFVDGILRHTGTSWENYYRFDAEAFAGGNLVPIVNRILFRTGGTSAPATAGNGFLIDNFTMSTSLLLGACAVSASGTTLTLLSNCTTSETLLIPDGWTLDGNDFSITAMDPSGGHFLGAVVRNGGASANVTKLTVTASGLANVCDDGDDRLRGILFDGASGSITNNTVTNVNQGPSGCQEGNAIEVRNAPFDNAGSDLAVTIDGNTVNGYIKNGITANGSVAATITNNGVTGSGPLDVPLAAQNGIQIGFGATAIVQGNTISGNNYTPPSFVACGLLLFEADGVKASSNPWFDNEKNLCNFGRGGGKFNPAP